MMYCNFNYEYITEGILKVENVKEAKVIEGEDSVIIAIVTKPIFSKSEINKTVNAVRLTAEAICGKKAYVTRSMEVFCDIINIQNNVKNSPSYEKLLLKVTNDENI